MLGTTYLVQVGAPKPPACSLEVASGVPVRAIANIGIVRVACGFSEDDCRRAALDLACANGADLIYGAHLERVLGKGGSTSYVATPARDL